MDNKLKIINYLGKHLGNSFSMHDLSKTLEIPYASFYRTVQSMDDIILTEKKGQAKFISANTNNPTLKSYLTISSSEEKKAFLENQPIMKKITNELETNAVILLFGSYAKNEETEKSDIDLLIINKDGKKDISFSKYELLFRKKINPIFITKKELVLMLKEKEENVAKQALKYNIILNNPEKFWELIINALK